MAYRFLDKPRTYEELPPRVRLDLENLAAHVRKAIEPMNMALEGLVTSGLIKHIQAMAEAINRQQAWARQWQEAFVLPRFKEEARSVIVGEFRHYPIAPHRGPSAEEIADLVVQRLKGSITPKNPDLVGVIELFVADGKISRYPQEKLSCDLNANRRKILEALSHDFQKTQDLALRLKKTQQGLRQTINEIDYKMVKSLKLSSSVILGDPAHGYRLNSAYKIIFLD